MECAELDLAKLEMQVNMENSILVVNCSANSHIKVLYALLVKAWRMVANHVTPGG
jgi:hypothetical protein